MNDRTPLASTSAELNVDSMVRLARAEAVVIKAAEAFMDAYNHWWEEDQGADGVWDDRTVNAFGDLDAAVGKLRLTRRRPRTGTGARA